MTKHTVTAPTMTVDATSSLDMAFIERFRRPATLHNPIRNANPLILLSAAVPFAVMAATLPKVVGPAGICLAVLIIGFLGGVGPSFAKNYVRLFGIVGGLLFVVRVIFAADPANALWAWGPFAISPLSIADAADFALIVMAMCGILTLFFALVPVGHLMLALEHLGVSRKASYVVLASFQAIIDLGGNTRTVMDAQKARGIETEGSLLRRAGAFFPVLTPVFLSAMSQTEERALALDARAFNAPTAHSRLVFLPPTGLVQWVILAVVIACAVFSVIGKVLLWH